MEPRTDADRHGIRSSTGRGAAGGARAVRDARRWGTGPVADGGRERKLGGSPYHDRQRDRGAAFSDDNGWAAVAWYGENAASAAGYRIPDGVDDPPAVGVEHLATRAAVGCYDLTPHRPIEIRGRNAESFLQRAYTADMRLDVGGIRFALVVEEDGGTVGDHVVTRLSETRYLAVAGPTGGRDTELLRERAPRDVAVIDRGSAYAGLGLWGPEARVVAESLTEQDLSDDCFPGFTTQQFRLGGVPVTAMRLSAVGEPGWELWTPTEHGASLWDGLWDAGADRGMVAVGDRAFASLTAERGNREWGTDMDAARNPYEVGLGHAVDLDTDFVGRDALRRIADEGIDRTLACLTPDRGDQVPDVGAAVEAGGETVGRVVRSAYGYSLGNPIAFAHLPVADADPGTGVTIVDEATRRAATVREEPVFDGRNGQGSG